MANLRNLVARDLLRGNLVVKNRNVDERIRRLEESAAEYSTVAHALRVDAAVIGQHDKDHVFVGAGGIQLMSNTIVRGEWQSDGDIFIGSDISDPGKTYLSVFATAQTYNSEAMEAGDMLIGDNSVSKANILWDKSAGQIKFRSGSTVQSFIDTDGSFVSGGGFIKINDSGVSVTADTVYQTARAINFYESTTKFGYLYGIYGSTNTLFLNVESVSGRHGSVKIRAESPGGSYIATASLEASVGGSPAGIQVWDSGHIDIYPPSGGSGTVELGTFVDPMDLSLVNGDARIGGGIVAGSSTYNVPGNVVAALGDGRFGGGVTLGSYTTDATTGYLNLATGGSIQGSTAYACRVYRTTALSMDSSTWYYVEFNAEAHDPRGMHDNSVNNSRITIQQAGFYHVGAHLQIQNHTNGYVDIILQHNRSDNLARETYPAWAGNQFVTIHGAKYFSAGAYVELAVWHNQGSAVNLYTATRFWAYRVA